MKLDGRSKECLFRSPLASTMCRSANNIYRNLGRRWHCVLEMPSETGKTVSLLSLIVAYRQSFPEPRKLICCSRTMSDIEKALAELKALMAYRSKDLGYVGEFWGLGLTSWKNLCLIQV